MNREVLLEFSDGELLSIAASSPSLSIYLTAQQAGIRLAHDCLAGTCGTCRSRRVSGTVQYLSDTSGFALPDGQSDVVLSCQAHAASDLLHLSFPYTRASILAQRKRRMRVTSKEKISATVWHLTCTAERKSDFLPGQYMRVLPAGFTADRAFSPCSLPGKEAVEFLVRELEHGAMSSYLRDCAVVGDTWSVSGPFGTFFRRHASAPSLYIAGGTGLAPILSMLREQQLVPALRHPKKLVFGISRPQDLFFVDELRALQQMMPELSVRICVLGQHQLQDVVQGTVLDALAAADFAALGTAGAGYMCGPPPMLAAVRAQLAQWGLPTDRLFAEEFVAS